MANDNNGLLQKLSIVLGHYLLPFIAATTALSVVLDKIVTDGSYIIQPSLSFANQNDTALTVILSGLLLFAYLMQYQNQRIQRGIMARQIRLMRAGYTPIIGVSSREWGADRRNHGESLNQDEANRLFLDLSNSGNSTARDIRLWVGVSYDSPSCSDYIYSSKSVPLRRTSDTSWWHSDDGGALGQTDGNPVEFKADPALAKVEDGWFSYRRDGESISLHKALEELNDSGVVNVEIGLVLKYTATTGTKEEIALGSYEANLPQLDDDDMRVYRAQENREERVRVIQKQAK